MKNLTLFTALLVLLAACNNTPKRIALENDASQRSPKSKTTVTADMETEAVLASIDDDAADDPGIWFNREAPAQSLIIGSDKTNGVDVYDLSGKRLNSYNVGPVNNVDVCMGAWNQMDIVGGSNRPKVAMSFWKVNATDQSLTHLGDVASNLKDVYGFCLYKDPGTNDVYAFVNSKTGAVEQWKLTLNGEQINGTLVRTLKVPSQPEGMVADATHGKLFVGEENAGIHYFDIAAGSSQEPAFIAMSGAKNEAIAFDIEGLCIYPTTETDGYLIASSQGNNTFAVFDRTEDHAYLGTFSVVDGQIDGVQETDGIDCINQSLPGYPNGFFVCQDGFNKEGNNDAAQNFKVVSWDKIQKVIDGFER